jgi:hypothetical protein
MKIKKNSQMMNENSDFLSKNERRHNLVKKLKEKYKLEQDKISGVSSTVKSREVCGGNSTFFAFIA